MIVGNAITQDSRALWLGLRRQGGWWTAPGLVRHWSPTFALWEVQQMLDGLVAGGFVMCRDDAKPGETSYAFTSECKPLPGAENTQEERHV